MKKTLLVAGIVAVALLAGLVGCSVETGGIRTEPLSINLNSQQTGIWVSGQGKITVTPDIATLTLGVSAQAATVADAQAQAAAAMNKVMAALTGNGVDQKDIKTQYFNIQQVTRYDNKTQQEVVIGYRVSNTVTAKVRAVDKTGTVIDAVAAAGGDLTRVNGISFSVDQPEKYYAQARELAMKDAKAKAEQMASLGGVKLGRPTYVTENAYYPPVPYPMGALKAEAAAADTTPISPGETDIILNVQVTYAIQ